MVGTGGVIGTGGVKGTGGIIGTGGMVGTGGIVGTGGVIGSGGVRPARGGKGTGGASGGTTGSGGVVGSGGSSGCTCPDPNEICQPGTTTCICSQSDSMACATVTCGTVTNLCNQTVQCPEQLPDRLRLQQLAQHLHQAGDDGLWWFGVHRNGAGRRDRGRPDLPLELAAN